MDHNIVVWHKCSVDNVEYHCKEYQRRTSTRLNNLVCIDEKVDANARFKRTSRSESMVSQLSYVYIQFYAVHTFCGAKNMLMYCEFRRTDIHDGLVEDKGHHVFGFQDVQAIDHLCARVETTREAGGRAGRKTKNVYIVDEQETMEKRLRDALPAPRR
jgi:hypothetical protein